METGIVGLPAPQLEHVRWIDENGDERSALTIGRAVGPILAVNAGLQVIGVVGSNDIEYVKALGSQTVMNYQQANSRMPCVLLI